MPKKYRVRTITYEDGTTLRDDPIERGTKWFFGRQYHWARNPQGALSLRHGPDPVEVAKRGVRNLDDLLPETGAVLREAGLA